MFVFWYGFINGYLCYYGGNVVWCEKLFVVIIGDMFGEILF